MNRCLKIFIGVLALCTSVSGYALEIQGVPFVRQESRYCGPASLAAVMTFHGKLINQQTIGRSIYSEKLQGALITDLENFAREKGFATLLNTGTPDELKGFLEQGRPVIVLVDAGVLWLPRFHYLVLIGYTDSGFIAHTGYKPSASHSYPQFEKIWKKAGKTFLLIYPSGGS
ncbi:C39 family peptidase [Syntrophus aciditrophicus]|uniref:Hypothetical exported protein n=1 Tax=Syntrophus aciditrophicus (strain SB) TaxID=56780 RepID=Q2LY28_SYNAS|nr:C39 family peptidase [Syntrophus aciditrophicus]ABC78991.1 hypothetical exported protein [Syntrophus aciditrophicus SB]